MLARANFTFLGTHLRDSESGSFLIALVGSHKIFSKLRTICGVTMPDRFILTCSESL